MQYAKVDHDGSGISAALTQVLSTKSYAGIQNEGDTCYISAVLQSFLSCPRILNFLLRDSTVIQDTRFQALRATLSKLLSSTGSIVAGASTLTDSSEFRLGLQHDTADFMINVWPREVITGSEDPCRGGLIREIKCLTCKTEWCVADPESSILPIPGHPHMSVAEIIESQFGSQQCTRHDGLYCKECKCVTDCTSYLTFLCPQTLCCRIISQQSLKSSKSSSLLRTGVTR